MGRPRTSVKSRVIYIRCSEETFKQWRVFTAEEGFSDYEKALRELMKAYRQAKKPRATALDIEVFGPKAVK